MKSQNMLSLWGLGPRPQIDNPTSNFHIQDLISFRIISCFQYNHETSKNVVSLGSGAQTLHLGYLGTKKTYKAITPEPYHQF